MKKIMLIIICCILLILCVVLLFVFKNKKYNVTESDILISIGSNGGFISREEMLLDIEYYVYKNKKLIVKFDVSGLIEEYDLEFDDDMHKDYVIELNNEEYAKIERTVSRVDLKNNKVKSDKNVMDGSSQHFTLYDKNNKPSITTGGYMVMNKKLNDIESSIYGCLSKKDRDFINKTRNNILKYVDEKLYERK